MPQDTVSPDDQWDIVTDVGLTALFVAAGRAVDTHRPDALIDDPWAERFVTAAHPPVPLQTRPVPLPDGDVSEEDRFQMMSGYMGTRTRWFDEYLTAAGERGVRQVVLVAAGLDSRALRLPWATGTTVFEIDQPAVLAFKDEVIARHSGVPTARRVTVPVDLRSPWWDALTGSGFDPGRPTAWLAEGLLPYLPAQAQEALLTAIQRLSAPGSSLALEDASGFRAGVRDADIQRLAARYDLDIAALVNGEEREETRRWLTRHGWHVDAVVAADAAAGYGRTLDPLTARVNGSNAFLAARR